MEPQVWPHVDWLARLLALRDKPERLVLGLNSGTSADAVDVAIVAISGHGESTAVRLVAFHHAPLSVTTRVHVERAGAAQLDASTLTWQSFAIGHEFAEAAAAGLAAAGLTPADLDLVASHGQTVCHLPR